MAQGTPVMTANTSRRDVLKLAGAVAVMGVIPRARAQALGRIVVVGGGFGGATCARYLLRAGPGLDVTLVEQNARSVTCPFSNTVLGGINGIDFITHGFDGLRRHGVNVVQDRVIGIDPDARTVRLGGGNALQYDRLVLSPGIDFKWGAIEGYDETAAQIMPHAWKAGVPSEILPSKHGA